MKSEDEKFLDSIGFQSLGFFDSLTWLTQGVAQLTQIVTRLWASFTRLTQGDAPFKAAALGEPRESYGHRFHGMMRHDSVINRYCDIPSLAGDTIKGCPFSPLLTIRNGQFSSAARIKRSSFTNLSHSIFFNPSAFTRYIHLRAPSSGLSHAMCEYHGQYITCENCGQVTDMWLVGCHEVLTRPGPVQFGRCRNGLLNKVTMIKQVKIPVVPSCKRCTG